MLYSYTVHLLRDRAVYGRCGGRYERSVQSRGYDRIRQDHASISDHIEFGAYCIASSIITGSMFTPPRIITPSVLPNTYTLYRNGLIRCRYDDVNLKIVSAFFGCIKKISIEERGYIRSYSKFERGADSVIRRESLHSAR